MTVISRIARNQFSSSTISSDCGPKQCRFVYLYFPRLFNTFILLFRWISGNFPVYWSNTISCLINLVEKMRNIYDRSSNGLWNTQGLAQMAKQFVGAIRLGEFSLQLPKGAQALNKEFEQPMEYSSSDKCHLLEYDVPLTCFKQLDNLNGSIGRIQKTSLTQLHILLTLCFGCDQLNIPTLVFLSAMLLNH